MIHDAMAIAAPVYVLAFFITAQVVAHRLRPASPYTRRRRRRGGGAVRETQTHAPQPGDQW